jgi:hypothetical protein
MIPAPGRREARVRNRQLNPTVLVAGLAVAGVVLAGGLAVSLVGHHGSPTAIPAPAGSDPIRQAAVDAPSGGSTSASPSPTGSVSGSPSSSTGTGPATPTTRPGGKPGPGNTGVPAGTVLTRHDGDLTITKDGTVIDALDVYGLINVRASNVTIRRTRVHGRDPGTTSSSLIAAYGSHRNLLIEDTTLHGDVRSLYLDGLKGRNFTARRLDISGVTDTVQTFGDNVTIVDSWLHDNNHYTQDPTHADNQSHDDNIQVQGGTNILIQHNTMDGAHNAAIMVTQDYSLTANLRVIGNSIAGGSCSMNVAESNKGGISGIVVQDNVFGASRISRCAVIAPVTSTPTMRNNVYTDGSTVTVRKG